MAQATKPLEQAVFESKMGRYEIVKLALDWIEVKKHEEDYRRLSQAELITKALNEVMDGTATAEKIEELKKKMKAKEAKSETGEAEKAK
ncbi:MAG: hypothetical protein FWG57_07640 [Endomicrobia bacterium]|jgi:hypothetical protein|nr:hypothetical protein [Endomicrobiia bacterium]